MTGRSVAEVIQWDVIDGGLLGAVIVCRACPCRSGTGCDGQGVLHQPYRLPGGAFIDTHRHAEALMPLLDPLPGPTDPPSPRDGSGAGGGRS